MILITAEFFNFNIRVSLIDLVYYRKLKTVKMNIMLLNLKLQSEYFLYSTKNIFSHVTLELSN